MNFQEYQAFTESLARYNTDVSATVVEELEVSGGGSATSHNKVLLPFLYPVLGLAEEAGEVAGKVAKFIRKGGTDLSELRSQVLPELGDVMYQLSETARQFGFTLDDVVNYNVTKLTDRRERNVLHGEGDNR